jgi:hypothetical protein
MIPSAGRLPAAPRTICCIWRVRWMRRPAKGNRSSPSTRYASRQVLRPDVRVPATGGSRSLIPPTTSTAMPPTPFSRSSKTAKTVAVSGAVAHAGAAAADHPLALPVAAAAGAVAPDLDRALSHLGRPPARPMLSSGSVKAASRGPCCCATMAAPRSPRHSSTLSNAATSKPRTDPQACRNAFGAGPGCGLSVLHRTGDRPRTGRWRGTPARQAIWPKPTGWRALGRRWPSTLPPLQPTISIASRPCCMCSHCFSARTASAEAF